MPAPKATEQRFKDRSASTVTSIVKVTYIVTILAIMAYGAVNILNS